jgi:peptide alpha-N-acetyltransferase
MKRPAAVLLALLRSTQALASSGEKARLALPETQNICLRFATKVDIPAISSCNLECLPENYNAQFYNAHLRQWPSLALVAEDISYLDERSHSMSDQDRQFFNFNANHQREPRIVAYLLGKIESRPTLDYDNPTSGQHRVETLGHVTSLAVRHDYRRLGLAKALMTQLHNHLEFQGIQSVGLHVRTSNLAACRLYERDGYAIEKIIPSYYQDGEDAYFMKKILRAAAHSVQSHNSSTSFDEKGRKTVPGVLQLPRRHHVPRSYHQSDELSSKNEVSSGASSVSFGVEPDDVFSRVASRMDSVVGGIQDKC